MVALADGWVCGKSLSASGRGGRGMCLWRNLYWSRVKHVAMWFLQGMVCCCNFISEFTKSVYQLILLLMPLYLSGLSGWSVNYPLKFLSCDMAGTIQTVLVYHKFKLGSRSSTFAHFVMHYLQESWLFVIILWRYDAVYKIACWTVSP